MQTEVLLCIISQFIQMRQLNSYTLALAINKVYNC